MAKLQSDFGRQVLWAIEGRDRDKPQDVVGIVAAVDYLDHAILTLDELNEALAELIELGRIVELAPGRYCEAGPDSATGSFTPVTARALQRACEEYSRGFAAAAEQAEEQEQVGSEIAVCWRSESRYPSDEELEESIEPFVARLEERLAGAAAVPGMEVGPGEVQVLIWPEPDADIAAVAASVVVAFRDWPCPPGSRVLLRTPDGREQVLAELP